MARSPQEIQANLDFVAEQRQISNNRTTEAFMNADNTSGSTNQTAVTQFVALWNKGKEHPADAKQVVVLLEEAGYTITATQTQETQLEAPTSPIQLTAQQIAHQIHTRLSSAKSQKLSPERAVQDANGFISDLLKTHTPDIREVIDFVRAKSRILGEALENMLFAEVA